jgi:ABC-type transport system substrate-binding protein
VTPGTIGYSTDLDPLPFDPDKARQILADEGYPNGEGFGKVIINTYVSPVHPYLPESAQVAADYWKRELNLDVEVRISEEAATKGALGEGKLGGQIVFYDNQARLTPPVSLTVSTAERTSESGSTTTRRFSKLCKRPSPSSTRKRGPRS